MLTLGSAHVKRRQGQPDGEGAGPRLAVGPPGGPSGQASRGTSARSFLSETKAADGGGAPARAGEAGGGHGGGAGVQIRRGNSRIRRSLG